MRKKVCFFVLLHVIIFHCMCVYTVCVYVLCPPPSSGILSDLFPGVSIPEHDYGVLYSTIVESLVKQNLQPLTSMTKKVRRGKVMFLYFCEFVESFHYE